MAETRLLREGMRLPAVARLQRQLAQHGFHTRADGMFGPATEAALRAFQQAAGLTVDGVAGPLTFAALAGGLRPAALQPGSAAELQPPEADGLSAATLRVALGELACGAREQGGNNRGAYVRKYMGAEGLPWCVGFASWCYRAACAELQVEPALSERWSSSRLVAEARALGLVVDPARSGAPQAGLAQVRPGHFFVLRGGPTGYSHTGIVRSLGWAGNGTPGSTLQYITTVEGNTRLAGEAAPDRVVSRFRGASALVFIAY